MKKKITFLLTILFTFLAYSQIGVYTENPLALFHVDGLANNKLGNTNYKDDVVIDVSKDSTLIMSIGAIPDKESSVQLDLAGEKSGLMMNKVALNSNTDISSLITPPINGTIVYNTVSNAKIGTGLFFHKDGVWYPLNSRNIISQIKYLNLSSTVQAYTGTQSYNNPTYSNYMYWTDPTLTNSSSNYLITLPETASYAFTVRLWGQRPSTNADARLVIYIWLLKDGIKQAASVLDVAELNVPVPSGVKDYSYSVTLSATVNAGDKVSLSVGAPNNSGGTATMNPGQMIADPNSDQNPSRTSVIYWKLQ